MLNTYRRGPYDAPYLAGDAKREWLIVERTGPDGSVLLLSNKDLVESTSTCVPPLDTPPKHTIVALLAECHGMQNTWSFLAVRNPLPDMITPGIFFPTEGNIVLQPSAQGVRLVAYGRCVHSRGFAGGKRVLHDVPTPPPSPEYAFSWHMQAAEYTG